MSADIYPFPDPVRRGPGSDSGSPQDRPRPCYTLREAVKAGLADKAMYNRVEPFVTQTFLDYAGTGTPRKLWKPRPLVCQTLARPFIAAAEQQLDEQLAARVDPDLDSLAALNETVKAWVDQLEGYPSDIASTESNIRYSGSAAVERAEQNSQKIEQDRGEGAHHHDRTPAWLRAVGRVAPFGEALGLTVFGAYTLNVDVLRPLLDLAGWTFVIVMVLVLTILQAVTVDHAAASHNHAREEKHEGHSAEAETARARSIAWGAAAATTAVVITGAMIQRVISVSSGMDATTTALVIALAMATGLGMPALAYWAKAVDGSKVSRERDGLADDLDEDLDEDLALRAAIQQQFDEAETIDERIVNDTLPDIHREVTRTAEAARSDYQFLHMQLGLEEKIPPPQGVTIDRTDNNTLTGAISSGVPHADTVDLGPTWRRLARLKTLRSELEVLRGRFVKVPEHPWKH